MAQDALEQVLLRNKFYTDSARKLILALLGSFLVIIALVGLLWYVVSHPPKPKYFATSINGRIIPLQPLDRPNQAKSAILQWANQAAIAAFTFNFVNYRKELQSASVFFTPQGWNQFVSSLRSSNNLEAVRAKRLVVSAVATGAPIILNEGVQGDGRYAWRIQMPILVTYQSASEISRQNLVITMKVVRVSTLDSPRGIGIEQFVAAPASGLGSSS
ncbi:MAG: type IVB secretion system apparatus protein IcmL/DotI [Gammaproteobacteria bacterium]